MVAYPQPTGQQPLSQNNGNQRGAGMDYEGFFKQRLTCSAVAEEVGSEVRTAGD